MYFLFGKERFLVERRTREIRDDFLRRFAEGGVAAFDFEEAREYTAIKASAGGGLFAVPQCVIIKNPLSVPESEREQWKRTVEWLGEQNDIEVIFAEPRAVKKTDTLATFLLKQSQQKEELTLLSGSALRVLAVETLAKCDPAARFDRGAVEKLLLNTGSDAEGLIHEVEKLASYKAGGRIEVADVDALSIGVTASDIFAALDMLARGDRAGATELFRREESRAEDVYAILSMCAWQVRQLLIVREAYDIGARRAVDIASRTGISSFVAEKLLRVAERFPMSRLRSGIALLAENDVAMKTGMILPEVALDLFIWKF